LTAAAAIAFSSSFVPFTTKMSGQPSLSASKIATPVPVVSMMYFFVETPPKVFVMVSPAFFAISTKWASGLGACSCRDSATSVAQAKHDITNATRHQRGTPRFRRGSEIFMSSLDGRCAA